MINFTENILSINDRDYTLKYRIYDAIEYSDRVIVLYHPDDGLAIKGSFYNLECLSLNGELLWTAEFPSEDNLNVYCKIVSKEPLVVNSMASYSCEVDLNTGKIINSTFYK